MAGNAVRLIVASGASARCVGLGKRRKADRSRPNELCDMRRCFLSKCPVASSAAAIPQRRKSLFLTRFASKVYLIHRRDKLRASKIMADRVLAHEKIEPIWNTVVTNTFRMKRAR